MNTLKGFINVHKDNLSHDYRCGVVYKLNCSSCDASYVGQTSKQLRTRISEHQRNFYLDYNCQSVVSKHCSDFGHDFYWNDVKILDMEQFYQKKINLWDDKYQNVGERSINLKKDTDLLDQIYTPLIDRLSG